MDLWHTLERIPSRFGEPSTRKWILIDYLEDVAYDNDLHTDYGFATLSATKLHDVIAHQEARYFANFESLMSYIYSLAVDNNDCIMSLKTSYGAVYFNIDDTRNHVSSKIRIVSLNNHRNTEALQNYFRDFNNNLQLGERRRRYVFSDLGEEFERIFAQ